MIRARQDEEQSKAEHGQKRREFNSLKNRYQLSFSSLPNSPFLQDETTNYDGMRRGRGESLRQEAEREELGVERYPLCREQFNFKISSWIITVVSFLLFFASASFYSNQLACVPPVEW